MGRGLSHTAAPHPECHPPSLLPAAGHRAALRALLDGEGGGAESSVQRAVVGGGGDEGGKTKHKGKEEAKHGKELRCHRHAGSERQGRYL